MINKKGNVIIITLFITLIVGVIGLIITKYMLNLLQISSENYKYYKSYYMAYAGIELSLGKNKNHGMGFDDLLNTGSETITKNFTGLNYSFSVKNISKAKYVSSNPKSLINTGFDYCLDKKNWIEVKQGEGILLPLVYDKNENGEGIFSGINYESLNILFSNTNLNWSGNGMFLSYQSTEEKIIKSLSVGGDKVDTLQNIFSSFSNPGYNFDKKPFLIIGSKLGTGYFCILSNSDMVTPYVNIVSKGSFMDRAVVLNLVKHNKWANFTIYGIY